MSSMNFTCDVCGREVFSCTFVNGMKFCAKCYQETFGETDKDRKIADLETKLAECEKSKESYRLQNEQHHLQLLQFYSRLGVEAFGADIHEKALETLMIMKEQLAEKDKEIEYYKKQAKKLNNEAQKYFEDAYCNDSIYQDKISFCIEQLEKVKETTECILDNALKNSSLNQSYYDRLLDEIDNQIKQLKVKAERS